MDKNTEQFAQDVNRGLSEKNKSLPSKYFYDRAGSRIFEEIMGLKEYYPTRSEFEILEKYAPDIAKIINKEEVDLIELGPGDGKKTAIILRGFARARIKTNYFPIDISATALKQTTAKLSKIFPDIQIKSCVDNFSHGIRNFGVKNQKKHLILFLGSNIGNLTEHESKKFSTEIRGRLYAGDFVLIGMDLKKDPRILQAAYDDSLGVTARFNLNLLRRINRELGGEFQIKKFRHHEFYNPKNGAMESYIISTETQTVYIKALEKSFHFEAWEPIHTEYSFKYSLADIAKLARTSGFSVRKNFFDKNKNFVDSLWLAK